MLKSSHFQSPNLIIHLIIMSGSLISEYAKALKLSALRNFNSAHRNSRRANTKHSNIKKKEKKSKILQKSKHIKGGL